MNAALLTNIKQIEIRDIQKPRIIKDTDVLVKIKMVGVCGSDIHYYSTGRIGDQIVKFPFIAGHEAAGVVESIGDKVTRVKPGQRIAMDPGVYCGECDQCLEGREHTCRNGLFMGCPDQLAGALSEYVVIDENSCFFIPEDTTFEEAVLSEPLSIAVYSVERSNLPAKANVAILGAGPIGMSVFHVLRAKNVGDVFITDKIQKRLDFSMQLNPKYTGNPDEEDVVNQISAIEPLLMDAVFECTGNPEVYGDAIKLLKPGGKFVIVGIPEVDDITLPIHELRRKEIDVVNIRRQVNCTQKAIDLMHSKNVNINSMATHHFKLEDTDKAYDLVSNYRDGVMKAMITID